MLKALTWFYVIYNSALATQQFAQREIIVKLFQIFLEAGTSRKEERLNIFPFAFRDEIRDVGYKACKARRSRHDREHGGSGTRKVISAPDRCLSRVCVGLCLIFVS